MSGNVKASAVIGANFGDEGKGLATDYLAAQAVASGKRTAVIRFNGGSQAAHTVVPPNEGPHVFQHFGAGTFAGADTILSRNFIVNPITLIKEREALAKRKYYPILYIDRTAPVTTPYDMIINQRVEEMRGSKKHGSCGMGINETLRRNEQEEFSLRVFDIYWKTEDVLKKRLKDIRSKWLPRRLTQLGFYASDFADIMRFCEKEVFEDEFIYCVRQMQQRDSLTMFDVSHVHRFGAVIFEGAQGLLLDQGHEFFPHVTPSNTGLKNVLEICRAAGIQSVDVRYVTRTYMTRHGAGPFPTERPDLKFEDETNQPNSFQGGLRFGLLDFDTMYQSISEDIARAKDSNVEVNPGLFVTCVDQIPSTGLKAIFCNSEVTLMRETVQPIFEQMSGFDVMEYSVGRSRDDVRVWRNGPSIVMGAREKPRRAEAISSFAI